MNTPPFVVAQQQLNGIPDTTALAGQTFDYFVPLTTIFGDGQTLPSNLIYTATLADGSSLASVGLSFTSPSIPPRSSAPASSRRCRRIRWARTASPTPATRSAAHSIPLARSRSGSRATDTGPGVPLSVTDTFFINVLPLDTPPVANNDAYSILEDATLTVTPATQGVLANDTDADLGDRLTAQLVSGPAHGTLQFHTDGTFIYKPTLNYAGTDSFTYVANDIFLTASNVATVSLTVNAKAHAVTASLLHDTGASATDGITNDATLSGSGFAGAAVFAAVMARPRSGLPPAMPRGAWSGAPVLADGAHTIVISETNALDGRTTSRRSASPSTRPHRRRRCQLVADTGAFATDGVTTNPASVRDRRPELLGAGQHRWRRGGVGRD